MQPHSDLFGLEYHRLLLPEPVLLYKLQMLR